MGEHLVLATWNVNSVRKRVAGITAWVQERRPHVICLQETKVVDDDFPLALFDNLGYEIAIHGQKSYNGVALASRVGLDDVSRDLPGLDDGHARVIEATVQGVRVLSVYAPNGGGRAEKFAHKMAFYANLGERLAALRASFATVAAGGDYNVAPHDEDVYDIDDYGRDSIAVSDPERAAYRQVLAAGYVDAHTHLGGAAHAHTWWDYRRGSFRHDRGLRIDHFLVSGGTCARLAVDREPRGRELPSDHAPVLLELAP